MTYYNPVADNMIHLGSGGSSIFCFNFFIFVNDFSFARLRFLETVMNTAADTTAGQSKKQAFAKATTTSSSNLANPLPKAKPSTIVLQPNGSLDCTSSPEFQRVLEESLEHVTDAVIVDFLWIESTDVYGVSALIAGIQRAAILGKVLTFQSMDVRTRTALASEWNRQREINFGPWNDLFEKDLERFLDTLAKK